MEEKKELLDQDERVVEIELERLRGFVNHPFKVRADSQMIELQESIKKYGILNPLIVRPRQDGTYEIISGHRRKFAAEKIGYRKVPVIIRVLKDDEAVVSMVDSNLQREMISPSEKGKTVSCVNLGIGLAQEGKKVLMIDADPQGSLTISLGYEEPDEMEYSLATLMMNIVNDEKLNIEKTILHHKEGVDLIPANIELSAIEVSLVNAMSRELILRSMVDRLREFYDYIIIDCIKKYLLATLFNAPSTISGYYQAEVNHDYPQFAVSGK